MKFRIRRSNNLKKETTGVFNALGVLSILFASLIGFDAVAKQNPACSEIFEEELKSKPVSRAPNLPEISQVSFIVPVYRELENGNIKSFLKRLDESVRHLPKTQRLNVSAVFAVNNTVEVATDANSPVHHENLRTIEYLKNELKSQRHPFHILIVDLATRGTERNMGIIRETAVKSLLGEAASKPEEHALVHMDVDTKLPPQFLKNLLKAYGAKQEVVFFARSYELRDELRTPLIKSHPDYKRKRAWRDLQILLGDLRQGVATYQISSRASTHVEIGGFKPLVQGEDTQLSRDLLQRPHLLESKIVVATEDRSRPDGFTSARRWEGLNGVAPRKNLFPKMLLLDSWIERAEELIQQGRVTPHRAELSFQALVKSEFGVNLSKLLGSGVTLRERYKSFLYTTSETPAQAAYSTFIDRLPPSERRLFHQIRDKRMASLARTEAYRQQILPVLMGLRVGELSAREKGFAQADPFLRWVEKDGTAELATFVENGRLNLENLRSKEPSLADWITPTHLRSVFREHASLVALYDGLARISEDSTLAPMAAAKLRKLQGGPK
jgi:hypothetical protein